MPFSCNLINIFLLVSIKCTIRATRKFGERFIQFIAWWKLMKNYLRERNLIFCMSTNFFIMFCFVEDIAMKLCSILAMNIIPSRLSWIINEMNFSVFQQQSHSHDMPDARDPLRFYLKNLRDQDINPIRHKHRHTNEE
jgi:hypothetical protein